MSKILVTGAGGYIGSIAAYLLLQKGHEVVAVDNFMTGYREPLKILTEKFGKEKIRVYEINLCNDLSSLFLEEKGIDAVVHYAASCLVDESMKNPHKYFSNNITGSVNLLEQMTKSGIRRLIFSSTAAVYGEPQDIPIDEKHRLKPINVYGQSKKMVEEIIEWYAKLKGLHYLILRYFNVCGASDDGVMGDSKKPSTHLVQNAVRGALGLEPFYLTSPEVSTPDKTAIRDYVNVIDLNEAHIAGLEYLSNGGQSEVVNLGTNTGSSVLEIVHQVQAITGHTFEIKRTVPRAGDPARLVATNKKARQLLNWSPKRTITASVKSLVLWYQSHPRGWNY